MTDPDRLTLLEERYAHLQRHVAEQDKVVLGLSEELDALREELALLRASGPTGAAPEAPTEERPPHY